MTEPVTYEEWCKQLEIDGELGIKVLIEDKLAKAKAYDAIRMIGRQTGAAIAGALFEGGYTLPVEFHREKERDCSLRAWEEVFLAMLSERQRQSSIFLCPMNSGRDSIGYVWHGSANRCGNISPTAGIDGGKRRSIRNDREKEPGLHRVGSQPYQQPGAKGYAHGASAEEEGH